MDRNEFEKIVEQSFERLPDVFKKAIENLGIVVEDYPEDAVVLKMKIPSKYNLLGLYHGIPLTSRGTWYGMTPVAPDKISLYQRNIESRCRSEKEIEDAIYAVLIHEIGHYFGMNDEEIRKAGY
jgi:predicted Zn-dependent protease with MMP-like domain